MEGYRIARASAMSIHAQLGTRRCRFVTFARALATAVLIASTRLRGGRSGRASNGALSSLARLLAEQALRLEDHDQDQDREHHRGGPHLPEMGVGDRLDHADNESAHDGALEVADAAHDRGREGDEARGEALVE